jgi:hypothetical protein
MISPVRGDYRRCQAETPLIDLFKFAEPALIGFALMGILPVAIGSISFYGAICEAKLAQNVAQS